MDRLLESQRKWVRQTETASHFPCAAVREDQQAGEANEMAPTVVGSDLTENSIAISTRLYSRPGNVQHGRCWMTKLQSFDNDD